MQIKTKMSYHLTPARMAITRKSINNKYTVGESVNWYSCYEEQHGDSFKN